MRILGVLEIPAEAAGQSEELTVSILQQACNDSSCLVPKTIKVVIPVDVAKRASEARTVNDKLFAPPANSPQRSSEKSRRG